MPSINAAPQNIFKLFIKLNRPQKKNAINPVMTNELLYVLDYAIFAFAYYDWCCYYYYQTVVLDYVFL